MKIIIAVLIFSLLVLFHELGHFLLAKFNKIEVLEFSLGLGPRLLSKKMGGTRYSIKALPFGGSCMMKGEDMDDVSEGAFGSKNVWERITVVAAGPLFNFLLAYILSMILIANVGFDKSIVLQVTENGPAAQAGLEPGDVITRMNGTSIHLYREVANYIDFHQKEFSQGKTISLEYLRDGEKHTTVIAPKQNGSGRYVMGISGSSNYRFEASPLQVMEYGAYEVRYWVDTTIGSLKMMLGGKVSVNDVSGVVGVVDVIGETYEASKPDGIYYIWLNMMSISILLSANLGVMNLLPIPALDGGRLLFLLIEAVRRKRLDPELEFKINFGGLMALMLFMVLIMFNDIRKLM